MIRHVQDGGRRYEALMFVCPGCIAQRVGATGLHMLPVNSVTEKTSWKWDGNLLRPTLEPSILTRGGDREHQTICHSYLRKGIFEFLSDCTHSLVGQFADIPDLPDWVIKEDNEK